MSGILRNHFLLRRTVQSIQRYGCLPLCAPWIRTLTTNPETSRNNRQVDNELLQQRLEKMKQHGGLSRKASDGLRRTLRDFVQPSYLFSRPLPFSVNLVANHLTEKFAALSSNEERINFVEALTDSELNGLLVQNCTSSLEGTLELRDSLVLECCRRLRDWDKKTILLTADIFYQMDCNFITYYRRLVSHFSAQWPSLHLSMPEISQVLFYTAYFGETSEQLMEKIETTVTNQVNDYPPQALSVICSAFFATNRRVKSPELVDRIAENLVENFNSMSYHLRNSALKVIRHASYQKLSFYKTVSLKLCENLHAANPTKLLLNLMEPLRCCSSLRIHDEQMLNLLSDTFQSLSSRNLDYTSLRIRSKDLSFLIWALAVFDHKLDTKTVEFLADWIRHFLSVKEYERYPEALVNGVMALVLMEHFPEDLISETLKSNTLNRIQALPHIDKFYHFLGIDGAATIECPNYRGYRLPKGFITKVPKSVLGRIHVELEGRGGLYALYSSLQDIFKQEGLVQCHFILPHFHTASIEIHLDDDNRPIKVPYLDVQEEFSSMVESLRQGMRYSKQPKGVTVTDQLLQDLRGKNGGESRNEEKSNSVPSQEPARRIAIEILGWNQVCYNVTDRLLATSAIKHRQLKKLGYEVLIIGPQEAHSLQDLTQEGLHEYTKEKIISKLNIKTPE